MRVLLATLSALSGACGVLLLAWGISRWQLPYNEEGRFFDVNEGVVYHLQTAELLTAAGTTTLIVASVAFLFVARAR
jgi:hypothetical protein